MSKPRKRPGTATNSAEAITKKDPVTLSRIAREIVSSIAIGAMIGVMFWSSVFGMVADFTSGPVAPVAMEVQHDGR